MKKYILLFTISLAALLIYPSALFSAPQYEGVMTIQGKPLYISVHGDNKDLPAMVCLPFGPGSSSRYLEESLVPLLKKEARLIFVDYTYSGQAIPADAPLIHKGRSTPGLSAADHADMILSLMTTLGIDRFGLLGHDYGAFIALSLLEKAPEKILFFIGVNPRINYYDDIRHLIQALYQHMEDLSGEESVQGLMAMDKRLTLSRIMKKAFYSPEDIETLFEIIEKNYPLYFYQPVDKKTEKRVNKAMRTKLFTPFHSVKTMMPYIYSDDFYMASKEETLLTFHLLPTLLLWGKADTYFSSYSYPPRPLMSTCVIPGAAFFPMLENPQDFKESIVTFLKKVKEDNGR